jgi:putative intracellular protease/amidase
MPATQACNFIRQAALGLQHAHERGMVHRDLKPQNLMVSRQGVVKILDFGLARVAQEQERPDQSLPIEPRAELTQVGAVMGTPDYMAPEQTRGAHDVDIRADIYSLGCTLYFLLKGTAPFPRGSKTQKMRAQVEESADALVEDSGFPPDVAAIIRKMMAKNPANRYQTPAEVAKALLDVTRSAANIEPPTLPVADVVEVVEPKRKRQRALRVPGKRGLVIAGIGAALIAVALLGALLPWRSLVGTPAAKLPVLFVLPESYYDADYSPVREVLERDGKYQVKVAASASQCLAVNFKGDPVGPSVTADFVLKPGALKAGDFAAVIVPGGQVFKYKDTGHPEHGIVKTFLEDMARQKKCVGGICHGLMVLRGTGMLQGKLICTPPRAGPALRTFLEEGGAKLSERSVQTDGWLVTGSHSDDAVPFAQAVIRVLHAPR